jgi:hypothetical protein
MTDIRQLTKEQVEALPKGAEVYIKSCGRKQYRRAYTLRRAEWIGGFLVVDYSFATPGYENTMGSRNHMAVYGQEKIAQKGDFR